MAIALAMAMASPNECRLSTMSPSYPRVTRDTAYCRSGGVLAQLSQLAPFYDDFRGVQADNSESDQWGAIVNRL